MESAGLALGALGLAGLFTTCTDCLELVQLGQSYSSDYELLQTKFEAQKMRFLIWGEVFGFNQSPSCDPRLEHPTVKPTVIRIFNNIRSLFEDEEKLSKRYGLRPDNRIQRSSGRIIFAESYHRFQARVHRTQHEASLKTKSKWAIADKQKFSRLVQDLKDLVDLLDGISRGLQLLQRNDDLMAAEVDSISDPESLRLLEHAFEDNERLSDTASRRLRLLDASSARAETHEAQAGVASSAEPSFHTAPSQQQHVLNEAATGEISQDVDRADEIPKNQRMVRDYRLLAIRSGESKRPTLPYEQQPDFSSVGSRLQRLKAIDQAHTQDVIERLSSSPTADQRRMILILEQCQGPKSTSFISLAPIGDDLMQILGRFEGPPGSPYEGGIFHVQISITEEFPFSPPGCRFLTKIYHPNIDHAGRICLEFLEPQHWRMELIYLEGIVLSICALLDQPNVDDPLVPEIAAVCIQDESRFKDIARQYTVKFANEDAIVLPSGTMTPQTPAPSWRAVFLAGRLEVVRSRVAEMIGWVKRDPTAPGLPAEKVDSYVNLLYQLSLQLHAMGTDSEARLRFHEMDEARHEEYENFFDSCGKQFATITWRHAQSSSFPQQSSSDVVSMDRKQELHHLNDLVRLARWLNGDKHLTLYRKRIRPPRFVHTWTDLPVSPETQFAPSDAGPDFTPFASDGSEVQDTQSWRNLFPVGPRSFRGSGDILRPYPDVLER